MGLSYCVELATECVNSLQTVECGDEFLLVQRGQLGSPSWTPPPFFLTPSLLSRGVRGSGCKLACRD